MKRKGTVFLIIGLLLIAAGAALAGYNFLTDAKAGAEGNKLRELLTQQIPTPIPALVELPKINEGDSDDVEYPDYLLDPNRDMPTVEIDGIPYIGMIAVPSQDIELPVIEGCTLANLKVAPCHFSGSVYLDNMVICAHNYNSHFGKLTGLRVGDIVTFTDVEGNRFTYTVLELEIVYPNQQDYMKTGDWDLTLFTCTWGGASRVTVRCERVTTE